MGDIDPEGVDTACVCRGRRRNGPGKPPQNWVPLPATNIFASENRPKPQIGSRMVFQASIFRWRLLLVSVRVDWCGEMDDVGQCKLEIIPCVSDSPPCWNRDFRRTHGKTNSLGLGTASFFRKDHIIYTGMNSWMWPLFWLEFGPFCWRFWGRSEIEDKLTGSQAVRLLFPAKSMAWCRPHCRAKLGHRETPAVTSDGFL